MTSLRCVSFLDRADAGTRAIGDLTVDPARAARAEVLATWRRASLLDPERVGEVPALLHRIAVQWQTRPIVTQEMQFARQIADRTVFMGSGRIVEKGSPNRLFDAPAAGLAPISAMRPKIMLCRNALRWHL